MIKEKLMESAKKSGSILGWGLILGLAVNLLIWVPTARADGPMEGVKGLIEEVQTILKNNPQKAQRVDLVEKATAKRSLESTWSGLNRGQQDEFVRVFSELLKASYANHLDDFAKTRVDYLGETNKAEAGEVRILVIRPNDKVPVNFRLLHEPQGWMIYDMVIEGVSMVENFRTQFAAMIQECSYGELVRCMKDKLKAECKG